MRIGHHVVCLTPAFLAAALIGACAEQAQLEAPGSATPAASAKPTAAAVPPPPASSASGPPLATVLTTDPAQLQQIDAAAAAASTAYLTPAAGPGDPIESGVTAAAIKSAPGMQPDGSLAKGTLKEGGHSEMMVNLQVGKCYAIVGFSPAAGIGDLDLHLLAPPLYNILSGEDTTDDNMPVIAKAPNPICPTVAVPLPYKVDIYAERGSGAFGVQLFSRPK